MEGIFIGEFLDFYGFNIKYNSNMRFTKGNIYFPYNFCKYNIVKKSV